MQSPFTTLFSAVGILIALITVTVAWSFTAHDARGVDAEARRGTTLVRGCLFGVATLVAAEAAGANALLTNVGAAAACLAGLGAAARLQRAGGLLSATETPRHLAALALAGLLWSVALALPAARLALPGRVGHADPLFEAQATATAALGSLGLALAVAALQRRTRALDLGVEERTRAMLAVGTGALLLGAAASALGLARAEETLPFAAALGAGGVTLAATARDARSALRGLRLAAIAAASMLPCLLATALLVRAGGERGPLYAVAGALVTGLVALAAPALVDAYAPRRSPWRRVLQRSLLRSTEPDPDLALADVLRALRELRPQSEERSGVGLYLLDPAELLEVDRAGYAQRSKAAPPPELLALAVEEPEGVARAEVLVRLEVREPRFRSLTAWLDERGIGAAAVLRAADAPVGLLTVPHFDPAGRTTLEQVGALRELADSLSAVVGHAATLLRAREREVAALRQMEAHEAARRQADDALARAKALEEDAVRRLARAATVATYSPGARLALDPLEQRATPGAALSLLTPPGVDALSWAAAAHLASRRDGAPFVVVEASLPQADGPLRWSSSERSPLRLAAGGTLVLLDAHCLEPALQARVARELRDDTLLIATLPATTDTLVAAGQLTEALADRLGARAIPLPALSTRGEDLRALTLDHLARIGLRLRGRPLALEPHALPLVLEKTWAANDAELALTLLRAALFASTDIVTSTELERAGLRQRAAARAPR